MIAFALSSPTRICRATIPCPPAGKNISLGRTSRKNCESSKLISFWASDRPSRSSPAPASTIASHSFSASLRKRVGTLPRRATILRSAHFQSSWCFLRTLPVAIVALSDRPAKPPECFDTRTSSIRARGNTTAISAPGFVSLGKSFALCTATSTSPARSARSISAVNNPFRPWRKSRTCMRRSSPLVAMIFVSIVRAGQAD